MCYAMFHVKREGYAFCVWRLSDKEATTEGGALIKRRLYGAGVIVTMRFRLE